ncbi:GNAT family N-acetyltransferase [Haematospirillum sp. 15-248]|uniref:GNAT family N-acetyltransferase n=1 Tax=Haematospirillum sp. 15-248 TaxID=2723107 RepID=UPI00168E70E4|nr:GNAT family N-acetyltransferase [Haematospirillum sp. 15-248]NKD87930.1 GNAT family N-acetyltransferase [Haematospirillum sp. 15-248]
MGFIICSLDVSGGIVHIRTGKPGDVCAATDVLRRSIVELCQEDHGRIPERIALWLANKTSDTVALWIDSESLRFVVAEDANCVVGVGAASVDGEILLDYVDPLHRFRGISRSVLSHLEAWISGRGHSTVALTSTRTALPFYLAAGYRKSGPVDAWQGMPGYPLDKQLLRLSLATTTVDVMTKD